MTGASTKAEEIVRQEVHRAVEALHDIAESPEAKAAVAAMAADIALLPMRIARGENTAVLASALRAEALNRSVELRARAQQVAQQAWTQIVWRLVSLALGTP